MTHAARLRQLLNGQKLILAPGAYDALTARLVQNAKFDVCYMTGGGTSGAYLGTPDLGLMTMSEMVDNAGRMAGCIDIPLIADMDTGYGNELNVIRAVREYEQRGVAGFHIEDQVFPKRCGHFDGKDVISREDFVSKIRASLRPGNLQTAAGERAAEDHFLRVLTDVDETAGADDPVAEPAVPPRGRLRRSARHTSNAERLTLPGSGVISRSGYDWPSPPPRQGPRDGTVPRRCP